MSPSPSPSHQERPTPKIRLAVKTDIPALVALAERYYVGHLDDAERADGFLSVLLSEEWFAEAIASAGMHVAEVGGEIVGFIGITDARTPAASGTEITRAILGLAKVVQFKGKPIANQRFAIRGPVLIDKSARGRGVYSAFNEVTREAYVDRFDVGVLFVSADNPRSLHTTTTKLGAQPLAGFEVGGRAYHLLAFEF